MHVDPTSMRGRQHLPERVRNACDEAPKLAIQARLHLYLCTLVGLAKQGIARDGMIRVTQGSGGGGGKEVDVDCAWHKDHTRAAKFTSSPAGDRTAARVAPQPSKRCVL